MEFFWGWDNFFSQIALKKVFLGLESKKNRGGSQKKSAMGSKILNLGAPIQEICSGFAPKSCPLKISCHWLSDFVNQTAIYGGPPLQNERPNELQNERPNELQNSAQNRSKTAPKQRPKQRPKPAKSARFCLTAGFAAFGWILQRVRTPPPSPGGRLPGGEVAWGSAPGGEVAWGSAPGGRLPGGRPSHGGGSKIDQHRPFWASPQGGHPRAPPLGGEAQKGRNSAKRALFGRFRPKPLQNPTFKYEKTRFWAWKTSQKC